MSTLDELEQHSAPNSEIGEAEQQRDHTESKEQAGWKEKLNHAIWVDDWIDVKRILDEYPEALTATIHDNDDGKTALHLATQYGKITIVEELLKLLPLQFLETPDSEGYTALGLACWYSGNARIAKCLIEKNRDLLAIPNKYDSLPVTVAFENDFNEMGRYLYSITPLEFLKGKRGSKLLCHCLQARIVDIALDLLQEREELLFEVSNDEGMMPIHCIATLCTDIPRLNDLKFVERWIYNRINTPLPPTSNHVSLDIQQEDRSRGDEAKFTKPGYGLLQKLITSAGISLPMKKIQELKLLHAQADELLHLVCKNARKEFASDATREALCLAAKEGNVEFVLQVSKVIPESFFGQFMLACISEAIQYRQATVFKLIHRFPFKSSLVSSGIDHDGNTLLHKVAITAPDHILRRITPLLQMQRELLWFKEVESLMPSKFRKFRNRKGLTAKELFRESHKKLMEEGEKWMKDTVSSCSIVSTLIVTIMFAAAITVPGGNDQNLGYPLFIKQPLFKIFMLSTILSFLSSSTSLALFLTIVTSRYSEEMFLEVIPSRFILCLSFLFLSLVGMIISFLYAISPMLKHTNYLWVVLVSMVASFPIFTFVLARLRFLLHMYLDTFEPIFESKVASWP